MAPWVQVRYSKGPKSNCAVAGIITPLSEGPALAEATEVTIEAALALLSWGRTSSGLLEAQARQIVRKNWDLNFKVGLHLKDTAIVTEFARSIAITLPITGLVNML